MDSSIHSRLADILPPGGLLTDLADLERYRRDGSGQSSLPSAVLLPKTTVQVQRIVQLAYEEHLPLTLRSGGTGLRGGAVAPEGGIMLSLSHMDRILEISPENSLAVVQPGISAHRLERHLESSGWLYPVDPASWRESSIGGDVATRAHGLREARYGPIGSYLLGLEVVISPGEIIRCGAKTLKYATGYHLVDLFAGSFGRLGIITQIILKLVPRPPLRRTLTIALRALDTAAEAAVRLRQAGLQPARLELIGPQAARRGFAELLDDRSQDGYLLLMELEAAEPEDLDEQTARVGSCLQGLAVSFSGDDASARTGSQAEATSRPEAASPVETSPGAEGSSPTPAAGQQDTAGAWWKRREKLLRRLTDEDRPSLLTTVRIPPSRLSDLWKRTGKILKDHSCNASLYGHLGEGRWHLLIHRPETLPAPEEILTTVSRTLEEAAIACGGFYLPPLALGWTPRKALVARHDSGQQRLWKALKNRFDPLELFGPIE